MKLYMSRYQRVGTALQSSLLALLVLGLSACGKASNHLNPFYETPPPVALQGEMTDRALYGGSTSGESARRALQEMRSYRAAQLPEPTYPVMQPAVVRVMWIPDHLNRNGDLIPAHYYYLKVLGDRWAVQDAFDLEKQLSGPAGSGGSEIPFMTTPAAP